MIDSGKRTYSIVVDYTDKETKEQHRVSERDLSFEDARNVSERYQEGENFMVRGVVIRLSDAVIEEFHIYDANRNDMTRKFVKSTPKKEAVPKKRQKEAKPLSKNVFIVHGKDHKPMNELKAMLYEFRLNPIVLHEKASGGLTLAEKYEIFDSDKFLVVTNQLNNQEWKGRVFNFGDVVYIYARHKDGFTIGIPIYDKDWKELVQAVTLGLNLGAVITAIANYLQQK